jgi:succinate dehydrogenase/fumarate reductase flavoprotein subunit
MRLKQVGLAITAAMACGGLSLADCVFSGLRADAHVASQKLHQQSERENN